MFISTAILFKRKKNEKKRGKKYQWRRKEFIVGLCMLTFEFQHLLPYG